MARNINCAYYAGPPLGRKRKVRARDSKTWKAGQFGQIDSGLWEPCASQATSVKAIFSQDQDTATSSTDVFIEEIVSTETRFVGLVSYSDSDYTAKRSQIGQNYGLTVSSNICSVNVNNQSSPVFKVISPLWVEDPYKNDSTDDPGFVVFRLLNGALDTNA